MDIFNTVKYLFGYGRCLNCGLSFEDLSEKFLCKSCEERLKKNLTTNKFKNRCEICSDILISEKKVCYDCKIGSRNYDTFFFLFYYEDFGKEIIRNYKFKNNFYLANFFAELLNNILKKYINDYVVVPVPGNYKNIKKRGWDPLVVICRELKLRGYTICYYIKRRKRGKLQKRLNKIDRLFNVKSIFYIKDKIDRLEGKKIILLDDVFTTGATANICSTLLKEHKVESVKVVTLARD